MKTSQQVNNDEKTLLLSAYNIMQQILSEIPQCNCDEAYTARGLTDPNCAYCDALGDNNVQNMRIWLENYKHLYD